MGISGVMLGVKHYVGSKKGFGFSDFQRQGGK